LEYIFDVFGLDVDGCCFFVCGDGCFVVDGDGGAGVVDCGEEYVDWLVQFGVSICGWVVDVVCLW